MNLARILLVADTHLGFDLPFRPRVERRRRGHDFFANFERALQPAMRGDVDLVVHGGDLLYRTRVPDALVEMALTPLLRVADRGIPVYMVPGNHERSRIPLHLMTAHPLIHVFDRPRTYVLRLAGGTLALSGFPFCRHARSQFANLVEQTRYHETQANGHLLCLHQTVEGAQVGVQNYTFREGADVVRPNDIPDNFAAVLSGHIHRAQVLHHDLQGRKLAGPIVYPGSIERTSFAEREEAKGHMLVSVESSGSPRLAMVQASFRELPTRPMVRLVLAPERDDKEKVLEHLGHLLTTLPADAVVQVKPQGHHASVVQEFLTAATLRSLAPATMNIDLAVNRADVLGRRP